MVLGRAFEGLDGLDCFDAEDTAFDEWAAVVAWAATDCEGGFSASWVGFVSLVEGGWQGQNGVESRGH